MLYVGLDEAPYTAEGRRNIVLFLASIAALTLAVSALVWWLGGRVARPLEELTAAAREFGEGVARPISVDEADPEEIRVLGETFNRMTGQIRSRTAELEASRLQAHRALDDYLEVLGFVAHELKSPLAGARMQLETIDGGYAGAVPETMQRPLAALRRAVDYGLEVAHGFNELSRADGEGFRARPREIADLGGEVIRPAVADAEASAAAKAMTLAADGEVDRAFADPDLLRVVLDNLIGNAVKYGREGTTVDIRARRVANGFRVEVRNEGVGVAPDKIGTLFRKFSRVQDPATGSTKGTGVGLYLVRRFVELHGGEVGVESEYGAWITFSFVIPDAPAGAP